MNAVEFDDVHVSYPAPKGAVTALRGLKLAVPEGTVFGFLGPNGAGKTTALHSLLGFVPPSSGQVRVFGEDVRKKLARRRIGYLAEQPDTYRFLTGIELLDATGRWFGLRGADLTRAVRKTLDTVRLSSDVASRRVGTYSRGMMQRICLAQALIHEPDLLILDEPTSGLDPLGRKDVRNIIVEWKGRGRTVFFSSHELSEVELVCDRVAILVGGQIVAEGPAGGLAGAGESLEQYFLRILSREGRGN